ncbi:DUF4060 family protein [Xenorhabdus sp. XENO-7]|uniref:DUF4060 family protein n=1 Tax=Xenorhabdus aichiensis TaxID=3025874 RepID=A0ABT5M264_9GAMM|nr:DUF4060 family protein [Xenorhabdus aichiensis]MDC9621561.1 DUF4060 family protein [Xenorhabdus aichiensis]
MRFIIRGTPSPKEREMALFALNKHKEKFGNYGVTRKTVTYVILSEGKKYCIEIANKDKSYVATVINKKRTLSNLI